MNGTQTLNHDWAPSGERCEEPAVPGEQCASCWLQRTTHYVSITSLVVTVMYTLRHAWLILQQTQSSYRRRTRISVVMFSDINNYSQGSVATSLSYGGSCNEFLLQISCCNECNSERIMKIGQYLAKLWTRVWYLVFLTHSVCFIGWRHNSDIWISLEN